MQGFCVKCRSKKEMNNPITSKTVKNKPITKGTCPDCGTTIAVFGPPKNA